MNEEILKGEDSDSAPTLRQRRIFLGHEMSGTFDRDDIAKLALKGIIVESVGWGQDVYELIDEPSGDDIMPSDD